MMIVAKTFYRNTYRFRVLMFLMVVLNLSACGGGGGGGSTPPAATSPSSSLSLSSVHSESSSIENRSSDSSIPGSSSSTQENHSSEKSSSVSSSSENSSALPANLPPIANAGADQTVNANNYVYLNARDSRDSDGVITSRVWNQLSGSPVELTIITQDMVSFIAPYTGNEPFILLEFQLTITDDNGATATDTITITVNRINQPPVVNAGIDQTVNAGDTVHLIGEGVDHDGEINSWWWQKVSGPAVTLTEADEAVPHSTFIAPHTGAEPFIDIEFRLYMQDNELGSGFDTVTIRVNRVNQAPTANAGDEINSEGLATVILQGEGYDPDGTISSYSWSQIDGPAMNILNSDQSEASFVAPSTREELIATFELTVTDNDGIATSDSVTVFIAPESAPVVNMIFPPANGAFTGEEISAFGKVTAKNTATITQVEVSTGSTSIVAVVEPDGSWRADNIPVPADVETFTITAAATDSENVIGKGRAKLLTDDTAVGSGDSWDESVAVVLDSTTQKAYVLTSGFWLSDVKLIPIDLKTGKRGSSITDFGNAEQGTTTAAFTHMLYDPIAQRFLLSSSPANQNQQKQIISVDPLSGLRTIISNADTGTGDVFAHPTGMALGLNNTLFVADNKANKIFSVDLTSGNRLVIADEDTTTAGVNVPLHLVWDEVNDRLLVTTNTLINTTILEFGLSATPATGTTFTSGNPLDWNSQGIMLDHQHNRLLIMNGGKDNIVSIDLSSKDKSVLASAVTGINSTSASNRKGMDYDAINNLIYVAGGARNNQALFVIDPVSGSKVVISR